MKKIVKKIKGPIIWGITFMVILTALFAVYAHNPFEKIGVAEMIIIESFVAFLFGGVCFILSNFISRYDSGIDFLPAQAIAGVILGVITSYLSTYPEFGLVVVFLWTASSQFGFLLGLLCEMVIREFFKLKIFPDKKMSSPPLYGGTKKDYDDVPLWGF